MLYRIWVITSTSPEDNTETILTKSILLTIQTTRKYSKEKVCLHDSKERKALKVKVEVPARIKVAAKAVYSCDTQLKEIRAQMRTATAGIKKLSAVVQQPSIDQIHKLVNIIDSMSDKKYKRPTVKIAVNGTPFYLKKKIYRRLPPLRVGELNEVVNQVVQKYLTEIDTSTPTKTEMITEIYLQLLITIQNLCQEHVKEETFICLDRVPTRTKPGEEEEETGTSEEPAVDTLEESESEEE